MVRQLRAGGCPEEELAKIAVQGGDDGEDFEIWPENADALRAFLFSETQWNVVATAFGSVHWFGLKYEAVERSFKNHPPANEVDAWDAVRMIEAEAVRLRNNHAND